MLQNLENRSPIHYIWAVADQADCLKTNLQEKLLTDQYFSRFSHAKMREMTFIYIKKSY